MQEQVAYSVNSFCEKFDIGRTKFYEELNAGRIRARKVGTKTLIPADAAVAWLSSLPPALPQAA
jgi:excisionase family DNA binding protein